MPPGTNYRILSLDGGGCWALLQARALQEIYGDIPGHQVLADFDLCAANSGGSIVLACLIENMRLSQIAAFFRDENRRRSVFVELSWYRRLSRVLGLGPRYSAADKINGLRAALPTTATMQMTELAEHVAHTVGRSPDFLITSFDYDRLRAVFSRSRVDSRSSSGPPASAPMLCEVVSASCNAPVNYFDAPVTVAGGRYWDGGIGGNNNPVLAALIEAKSNGAAANIKVLSLGTGTVRLPLAGDRGAKPPLAQPLTDASLMGDVKLIASAILDDPPDAASFITHVVLGGPLPAPGGPPVSNGSLVRLSPLVQPVLSANKWGLPTGYDQDDFESIANLDLDAIKPAEIESIWRLGDAWVAGNILNQPIRASRDFECQIGHRLFAEGRDAWKAEVGR